MNEIKLTVIERKELERISRAREPARCGAISSSATDFAVGRGSQVDVDP